MLPNSLFQRLVKWCPWLLRDEPKQPVKVLVTGAAGMLKFRIHKAKPSSQKALFTLINTDTFSDYAEAKQPLHICHCQKAVITLINTDKSLPSVN